MKFVNSMIIIITLLFLSSIILGTAFAGDDLNPEVDDDTDEQPGNPFRDIVSAWFSESNTTVIIKLMMAGSPPGLMDLANNPDTTIYEYEVYFDVEGTSYAVAAIIQYAAYIGDGTPLGGVYSTDSSWDWELREINYAQGTDIIQSETVLGSISTSDYDSESVVLGWEIDKEQIGIGEGFDGRGQLIENTWAAIWNTEDASSGSQRDPKTQSWDYANTHHSNPGRTYRITGFGGVDYNIILFTDENKKAAFGGTPVGFLVNAKNNGTHNFQVVFFSSEPPEGWTVEINPNSTTIAKGANRPISVLVTPPKDVVNDTSISIKIEGNIRDIEGNGTIPVDPPLTLTIIGLSTPGVNEEKPWWENLIDTIKENILIVGGAIAVVIIAIIILAILIRR
ncbi:MAG: NEW3 domain-containing protein [Promethearchaeota archaeon]|jgi:hypothetical protein